MKVKILVPWNANVGRFVGTRAHNSTKKSVALQPHMYITYHMYDPLPPITPKKDAHLKFLICIEIRKKWLGVSDVSINYKKTSLPILLRYFVIFLT